MFIFAVVLKRNRNELSNMNEEYQFLTHAPVHRVIGAMAFPTIISMLLTSVYNLVDTFFVGQIDTQSTAAVGIVFSVMFFIQAFSFFFGNGSGNYISRQLGAQKTEDAETMASTGLFYTLAFSILTMLLGLLFLEPISILLGSTPHHPAVYAPVSGHQSAGHAIHHGHVLHQQSDAISGFCQVLGIWSCWRFDNQLSARPALHLRLLHGCWRSGFGFGCRSVLRIRHTACDETKGRRDTLQLSQNLI